MSAGLPFEEKKWWLIILMQIVVVHFKLSFAAICLQARQGVLCLDRQSEGILGKAIPLSQDDTESGPRSYFGVYRYLRVHLEKTTPKGTSTLFV